MNNMRKSKGEGSLKTKRNYTADELQNFNARFQRGELNREEANILKRIESAYNALPKALKRYESNRQARINQMFHTIIVSGTSGNMKPKKAMRMALESERKMTGYGTLKLLFTELKSQRPDVYSHYNSYVYRLGHSSAKWFYDNGELSTNGSITTCVVELPKKTGGTQYTMLYLVYNHSGGEFEQAIMQ